MRTKQSIVITSLILFACVAGCATKEGVFNVDQHADIPKGSIPEPAGRKLDTIVTQQILSADQDRFALYVGDFIGVTALLSPNADQRLMRLNASGELETSEVIIQPSGDETLDANRIKSVQKRLEELGDWNAHVHLAKPPALPLTSGQIGGPASLRGGISSGSGGGGAVGGGGGGRSRRSLNAPFGSFTRPL